MAVQRARRAVRMLEREKMVVIVVEKCGGCIRGSLLRLSDIISITVLSGSVNHLWTV